MQKAFEIEKTTAYPLGVSFQPEGMHISTVFEQTDKSSSKEKGILLYDAKYRDGISIFSLRIYCQISVSVQFDNGNTLTSSFFLILEL